jgi:hypothetical protein
MDRSIPSEFAEFVRTVAIRALDRLSARGKEFGTKPRAVLRAWDKLSSEEKSELIDQLVADTQDGDEGPPLKKPRAPKKPAAGKAKRPRL